MGDEHALEKWLVQHEDEDHYQEQPPCEKDYLVHGANHRCLVEFFKEQGQGGRLSEVSVPYLVVPPKREYIYGDQGQNSDR